MRILVCALCILLAGCATGGGPRLDDTYQSRNQDSRVQFLVLHFTSSDFPNALHELTVGSVSSHYLVDTDGTIYRLVPEEKRAWHAGVSSWRGQTQLNAASIGIEIVNRGDRLGDWQEFTRPQVDALMELVRWIVKRHGIRPDRVVGHSDIAPLRKIDPGPLFPWKRLADAGLSEWPDEALVAGKRATYESTRPDAEWFQQRLACVGYSVERTGAFDEQTRRVLSAFQMHFRPADFSGTPDAETAAILDALATLRKGVDSPAPHCQGRQQ